jgi:hypothetical protein
MPLDVLLRAVWALKYRLAALSLLILALGAWLILSWPRAYTAQAIIAPAETTGLAISTLISASALSPGSLLDTRPSGNFAVYLAALRSPEAAAMLARDTGLLGALEARRASGPAGQMREALGLRHEADQDDADSWLERSLAVTQSVASVTWMLEVSMADRALAMDILVHLHAFAEAKVRGDLLDLINRRVQTLQARLATERDIYLRTPIFELVAQHQRAALVLMADAAVAARLVSGPGVELKPSVPNQSLLLAMLLVAGPMACLFGGYASCCYGVRVHEKGQGDVIPLDPRPGN